MNKEIRKVKSISKNVLEFVVYYSKFNLLYIFSSSFHLIFMNMTSSQFWVEMVQASQPFLIALRELYL